MCHTGFQAELDAEGLAGRNAGRLQPWAKAVSDFVPTEALLYEVRVCGPARMQCVCYAPFRNAVCELQPAVSALGCTGME